jgi:PAS domain S-box-containing protein
VTDGTHAKDRGSWNDSGWSRRGVWFVSLGVLALGLILTIWGILFARDYYHAVARARFEVLAERLIAEFDRSMKVPVYGLRGIQGLYAASQYVSRDEFKAYVASRDLPREFPGLLAFGYMEKVRKDRLPAFVQKERAEGAPDFKVFPSTGAPDSYVIKYIEPMEANRQALGFDAGSDPLRLEAILRAMQTGEPALTERIVLLQAKNETGLAWLIPVYANGAGPPAAETREQRLAGLGFAHIVLDRVLADLMDTSEGMLDLEVFQGLEKLPGQLILDADGVPVATASDYGGRHYHQDRRIVMGGQTWTCSITDTAKFDQAYESAMPQVVGAVGALLTGGTVLLFWLVAGSRDRALALAEKMTENLRVSEAEAQRLAVVASRTDNSVIITDAEGKIVWVNEGFSKVTGFAFDEVKGRRPGSFLQGPGTDPEMVRQMHEGLAAGRGFRVEILNYRKDGGAFWSAIEVQPLRDAEGVLSGFMAIESDVTARKKAEEELLEAKQAAEAANRAKSEFLAMMSHEIRTPMNGVIGMTSLLLDTPLNGQQREYTEIIRSSGETLLSLINDILDFSKVESGRLELEHSVFCIRECVEAVLDLLAVAAAHKGIDLLYDIGDEVPGDVRGDVTRIRQILVNLVGNALKFTSAGEVEVSVHSHPVDDGVQEILFAVRDTGIGIPEAARERLFRPFVQVDASTTRKYGGTGLGLAISRKLAELMGGRLWVESETGKGSTFSFTIRAETVPSKPKRFLGSSQLHLKGSRLLVVDDNATNRRILCGLAAKWGMEVAAAESGPAALALLEKESRFDFAILDMHMPEMDGFRLAEEYHKRLGAQCPPLILLSSLGSAILPQGSPQFAAVLTKPAKPSQIYDALVNALERGKKPGTHWEPKPQVPVAAQGHVKILLAEDNAVNQKVARAMLASLGYGADVAGNGLEVLEALERQDYDVVLMDVQMPEMDGLLATKRIREAGKAGRKTPWIIALTANAMPEDRDLCLEAGMDDYLSKPIKKEELEAALGRALKKEKG